MDWVNIASGKHKCKIVKASSSQNQYLHPPSSIIQEDKQNVWISGEGLPQQLIISLQEVEFPYQFLTGIGFSCAHDYDTNPKIIQIWTAKDSRWAENGQFVHWDKVQLKKKSGRQIFSISQIPQSERIIKILITQTFGQFHTYLNQVLLFAQPEQQTSQSLFNNLQQNRISPYQNKKIDKKSLKSHKSLSQKNSVNKAYGNSSNERTPLQLLDEYDGAGINISQDRQKDRQKSSDYNENDKSFQKNSALLAMSKNMIIMEDHLDQLSRKVQVLQKKVQYTLNGLQENLLKKVEHIIEQKIEKKLSQKDLHENVKKLKSSKDLTTSRTISQYNSRQKQKQKKVMSLVAELNGKLKQRAKLANKLEKRLQGRQKQRSQYYE